jgi:hypothetical protein
LVLHFTGALPDQLEVSKDCRTILVANEGEPTTYEPPSLENDPEGSVSVIQLCSCDGDRWVSRNGLAVIYQGVPAQDIWTLPLAANNAVQCRQIAVHHEVALPSQISAARPAGRDRSRSAWADGMFDRRLALPVSH